MSPLSRSGSRQRLTRPASTRRAATTTTAPAHRPSPATPTDTPETTEPVLYTAEQAAVLLQVRPSWLRRKAAARAIPCRYIGKHLRCPPSSRSWR